MSYNLCQEKMEVAADLAIKGCSVRQIAKGAGIASAAIAGAKPATGAGARLSSSAVQSAKPS